VFAASGTPRSLLPVVNSMFRSYLFTALRPSQVDQWAEFASTDLVPADLAAHFVQYGPVMRTLSNMGVLNSLKQQEVLSHSHSFLP
jgi:hypothetical protein